MKELENLRSQLDEIDTEIINLLSKRFEVIKKIGKIKKKEKMPIFDQKRWESVIAKRKKTAKERKLDENFIEKLYNEIHEHALKIEREQA